MPLAPQQASRPASANTQNVGMVVPFARASRWHIEQGDSRAGLVISGTPAPVVLTIPSYGYLAGVFLTVAATGGVGIAATYYEDAPWSAIQQIQLSDVNGVPIVQLDGYSAFLAAKFGGYKLFGPDPAAYLGGYQPGTADGNFRFTLPIWLSFGRDGLGCLPNMDASASYRLTVQLATAAAGATGPLYTAANPGLPTVALTVHGIYRSQPPAADSFGNRNATVPPAIGTVGYWSRQTWAGLTGAQTIQLSRVGNLIRNQFLIFRDTADGTRATAETSDLPPSIEYDWDSGVRYVSTLDIQRLREFMARGTIHPAGVVFYGNTDDPDGIAGAEYGDSWMPTSGASKLTLRFTPAASCGLTVITNDVVPSSQQVYSAANGG